ncbi:hypothetical protein H8959_014623 [Pygathrix nigripes]
MQVSKKKKTKIANVTLSLGENTSGILLGILLCKSECCVDILLKTRELAGRRAEPGDGGTAAAPRAGRPRGLWDRLPHFLPAPTGSRRQRAPQKALQGRRSGPDALGRTALGTRHGRRAAEAETAVAAAGEARRWRREGEGRGGGGGGAPAAAAAAADSGPSKQAAPPRPGRCPRLRRSWSPGRALPWSPAGPRPRRRASPPPRRDAAAGRGDRAEPRPPPPGSLLGREAPEPPRRSPVKVSPPGLPRVSSEGAGPRARGRQARLGAGPEGSRPAGPLCPRSGLRGPGARAGEGQGTGAGAAPTRVPRGPAARQLSGTGFGAPRVELPGADRALRSPPECVGPVSDPRPWPVLFRVRPGRAL